MEGQSPEELEQARRDNDRRRQRHISMWRASKAERDRVIAYGGSFS
jgi:hypothetical protein